MSTLLIGLTLLTTGAAPTSASGLKFTQISAGDGYVCGVTKQGAVYCVGDNGSGQLGDGSDDDRTSFTRVLSSQRFSKVFGGYEHTCAITVKGEAYCWGVNGNGQLGDGTTTNRLSPVKVLGLKGVTDLALGSDSFTCAMATRGTFCWGFGATGVLGNGGTESSSYPVAVTGGAKFTDVSVQEDFPCALSARGTAQCWGPDGVEAGQGIYDEDVKYTVPVGVLDGRRFVGISAGSDGACGLTSRGAVYCWGNDPNALGGADVTYTTLSEEPFVRVVNPGNPQLVLGGVKFSSLAETGGENHFCGITSGGAAYCWGDNWAGQLGTGDRASSNSAGPRQVVGGLKFSSISINEVVSCGLTSRGQVWCWGAGPAASLVPVLID
jgi:alpha-tubulin suppressor-like RCC1 family protein